MTRVATLPALLAAALSLTALAAPALAETPIATAAAAPAAERESGFLAAGMALGVGDPGFTGHFQLQGGVRPTDHLRLYGILVSGGAGIASFGSSEHRSYQQVRAGAEGLLCSGGEIICGVAGLDAGGYMASGESSYSNYDDTSGGSSSYSVDAAMAAAHVGLELGSQHLRLRLLAEGYRVQPFDGGAEHGFDLSSSVALRF
jgi:hypothetical protein